MIEIAEMDLVAILTQPSAEGAIQMAMERLPITYPWQQFLCARFGGWENPCRMLHGIGARTTVVARKRPTLARVLEMGYRPIHLMNCISLFGGCNI